MDHIRPPKKKLKNRVLTCLFVLSISLGGYAASTSWMSNETVSRSTLTIAKVQQGDLPIKVKGFGKLKSADQRFITAHNRGVVDHIFLMPGAEVEADSTILSLSNPDLQQSFTQAKIALQTQLANLRQLKLEQSRERLDENQRLDELTMDYHVAEQSHRAKSSLAEAGIVSGLDFIESQAKLNKIKAQQQRQRERIEQFKLIHQEAIKIANEACRQKQALVDLAKTKVDKLKVTSGSSGILQSLPVKLGESVTQGQKLAQIGGKDKLLALIKVPQSRANQILPGMAAKVDTRGGIADAKVRRINPVVEQGNIEIELQLEGEIPSNARPDLNIEASIELSKLKDVLYLSLPLNAQANSQKQVYLLQDDNKQAKLTALKFGQISDQYIELQQGASLGKSVILDELNLDTSIITLN